LAGTAELRPVDRSDVRQLYITLPCQPENIIIIIIIIIIINEKINVAFSPKTARTCNTHKKDDVFGRNMFYSIFFCGP